jgi:3-dehydroquinate synthase
VGDAAGFAAATYMRGIDWIVVPTTLLSMVDSSIGGKVGVNHARSKNLVGSFHQPRGVVVDLAVLGSLPRRELRGGSYEVLNCALIGDAPLFDALALRGSADTWPSALMRRAVEASIRLKATVVSRDEREGGLRLVLNLGHTFGHALEASTDYERFNHGEAVGHGLLAAAHISRSRGLLSASALDRLRAAVDALGPRPSLSSIAYDAVRRAMGTDKKALSSCPTFVLPQGIGRVVVRHDITESELRSAWAYVKSMEP